jgi:hypothetical protein
MRPMFSRKPSFPAKSAGYAFNPADLAPLWQAAARQ